MKECSLYCCCCCCCTFVGELYYYHHLHHPYISIQLYNIWRPVHAVADGEVESLASPRLRTFSPRRKLRRDCIDRTPHQLTHTHTHTTH
eukprot:COSAG05_NODE_14383_length_398_cov_0.979933_1_plen_88_part_01